MTVTRPIGYWVKTVDQLIDAQFAGAAADMGITRRQWQILNVLAEHDDPARGGATRDEVTRELAPFLPADTRLDEHLAGIENLVTVTEDRLVLTPEGRERLGQVRARSVQQLRDRVAVGLSRDDYDTTLRTLEQIARNLGWSDPQ